MDGLPYFQRDAVKSITGLAASGTISRDLFDEDGVGYVDGSALLDRLTLGSLEAEVAAYLDTG